MDIVRRLDAAAKLEEANGIPPFIAVLILTESGALVGIAAGVGFGLMAEASAGIVAGGFYLGRINATLKEMKAKDQ